MVAQLGYQTANPLAQVTFQVGQRIHCMRNMEENYIIKDSTVNTTPIQKYIAGCMKIG